MRKLKFHEQRLLRKTSFTEWKDDNTPKEQIIRQKYQIENMSDFYNYSKLAFLARKIANLIAVLKNTNRNKMGYIKRLGKILHSLGIIDTIRLKECCEIKLTDFCERRLAVVLLRRKMCENLERAIQFIEHGHVEIFNRTVRDPAILIPKDFEKYVRWSRNSKIHKKIAEHANGNEESEDF